MMCGPYWNQWSMEDLHDWLGCIGEEGEEVLGSEEEECGCGNCMECLMLEEGDFE